MVEATFENSQRDLRIFTFGGFCLLHINLLQFFCRPYIICLFCMFAALLHIDELSPRLLLTFKKATAGGLLGGMVFTQGKHRCLTFSGTY